MACDLGSSLWLPDHRPYTGVLETAAHFASDRMRQSFAVICACAQLSRILPPLSQNSGYAPAHTDKNTHFASLSQHNCITAMAGRMHCLGCGGGLGNKSCMRKEFSTPSPTKKSKRAGDFCCRQSVVQYNAGGSRLSIDP